MNKRLGTITGAVIIAGGIGAGTAAYASASSGSSPGTGDKVPVSVEAPPEPFHGKFRGFDRGLRGETVFKDKNGKIQNHVWQRGKVTSLSDSELSVQSSDGTTWTWKRTKDTKVSGTLKKDGEVRVSGLRSGETRTASHITDGKEFEEMRKRMRDMRKHGPWHGN